MTQSSREGMAGVQSEKVEKPERKPEPFSNDLKGLKFDKKGIANKNFIFSSRTANYSVVLLRGKTDIGPLGKNVVYPSVIVDFRNGVFVLDNIFRNKYYQDKRDDTGTLSDFKILQRLRNPVCGYMREYFFVQLADNSEAKHMRLLANAQEDAVNEPTDPLGKMLKEEKAKHLEK